MKTKEYKESLTEKTESELKKELEDNYRSLQDLRFGLSTKKIKNYKEIKETKKKIARLLTLLRQRKITATSDVAQGSPLAPAAHQGRYQSRK